MGVIGESDIVAAFRTVGMHVADARTPQQEQQAVHRMVTEGVSVLYIPEGIARTIPETLARYNADPGVAIIPIPGSRGTDGGEVIAAGHEELGNLGLVHDATGCKPVERGGDRG